MSDADAQAVARVLGAVLAGGQAVEVGALHALQAQERVLVAEQRAGFLEREQVRVELVDDLGAGPLERVMKRLQAGNVLGAEIEEGLARGDLLVGDAKLPGNVVEFGRIEIQAEPPLAGR